MCGSFAASCNDPSLAVLPAGEGVGGYCTNGFALPNCAYSPNTPDFCGDQKFEVVSANFQNDKVCCDGRDDAGNDLNGMECVDMTGACSDTLSPLESNQPITQQETGSQCWDGVDNDCDGWIDNLAPFCRGDVVGGGNHEGEVICGTGGSSYCDGQGAPSSIDGYGLQCESSNADDDYGYCVCPTKNPGGTHVALPSSATQSEGYTFCMASAQDIAPPFQDHFYIVPQGVSSLSFAVSNYGEDPSSCSNSITIYVNAFPSGGPGTIGVNGGDKIRFATTRSNKPCLISLKLS